MSDPHELLQVVESALTLLRLRLTDGLIDPAHYNRCMATLFKLISNIANSPKELKFRSFKKANANIQSSLCDGSTGAMIPEVFDLLTNGLGFVESVDSFEVIEPDVDVFQVTAALLQEIVSDARISRSVSESSRPLKSAGKVNLSEKQRIDSLNELQRAREERSRGFASSERDQNNGTSESCSSQSKKPSTQPSFESRAKREEKLKNEDKELDDLRALQREKYKKAVADPNMFSRPEYQQGPSVAPHQPPSGTSWWSSWFGTSSSSNSNSRNDKPDKPSGPRIKTVKDLPKSAGGG